jgi:16S rRNA G966 N2-methylase RsmD
MSNLSFPYIKYSKKDIKEEFNKLQNYPNNILNLSNIGNKISNSYFQKYRYKTICYAKKRSPYNEWKINHDKIISITKNIYKIPSNTMPSNMQLLAGLRLYGCSIAQFRPLVARYIYLKYGATHILDPSAGWGDRLIASIAIGAKYTGFDTNISLKRPYEKMIKDFDYKNKANIHFIDSSSKNAEDIIKKTDYDMIFTSPPYSNIEIYEHMPTKIINNSKSGDKRFIEEFLLPVFGNSFKYLKKGGVMAINMPDKFVEPLIKIINIKKYDKIKMPIRNRFVSRKNKSLKSVQSGLIDGVKIYEHIHIFHK